MNRNALQLAEYTLEGGQVLSAETVKRYISKEANEQEILMFIELCKAQKLNPFVRDAYLVKYGSNPAQIIVGKDVFIKRANANPNFDGMKAGIVVLDKNGQIVEREGALKLKNEELVGGWCEVYLKDKKVPIRTLVSFDEYAQRTKTGQLNSMWQNKGATMIRKVAQSHALREAFPEDLRGLYQQEEMGVVENLPQKEIVVGMASAEQKKKILCLASVLGLYDFNDKGNTKELEYFCEKMGFNLETLDYDGAEYIIKLLTDGKKIKEQEEEKEAIQDIQFKEVNDIIEEGQLSM